MDEDKPPLEDLVHFGVKGMHWGTRKAVDEVKNTKYSSYKRKQDAQVYGKKGVARINRRMNKGVSYKKAVRPEGFNQAAQGGAALIATYGFIALVMSTTIERNVITGPTTQRGENAASKVLLNLVKPSRSGVYNIRS